MNARQVLAAYLLTVVAPLNSAGGRSTCYAGLALSNSWGTFVSAEPRDGPA